MTTSEEQTAAREAKSRQRKKDGFSRFMDQPATRMMVSMVPADEKQVLQTLLQETFNAGFSTGSGDALGDILEAMLKGVDKRTDRTAR
jgi:hypothetical protein